ncbi:PilN domain-containing protein [bacterium]|nr:PilN domain-containing protein [bacterium]
MSLRVNLLPEARILKLKNQQTRRMVTIVCLLIVTSVGASIVILLLLLGTRALQYNSNSGTIDKLKKDIENKMTVEQDVAWFNDSLDASYTISNSRILISQLFDQLTQALPKEVKMTALTVDPSYQVKATVTAPDFNTVALFGNALSTFNTYAEKRIPGMDQKAVFTEVKIDSVSNKKNQSAEQKEFTVVFTVDKDLVQKFRNDASKTGQGS